MNNISFILCAKTFKESMFKVMEGVQFHKKIGDEFLLVTNDCDTLSFSPSFLKYFDKVLFPKITGCGESRRIGVEAATNDLIAFVDDDTLLLENWRSEADKFLEIPSVAFFHARSSNGGFSMLDTQLFNPFIFYTDTAGSVFRRPLVLAAGNFDPEMTRGEDTDMATKICCRGWDVAVGSVAIRDIEKATLLTIIKRFIFTLEPDAKIFLRAGFRLKVRNFFQIPIMLTKMGHRPWSIAFYQLLIRFILVFRKQENLSEGLYIREKRKKKVLVSINGDAYLLSDSVRIVFGRETIRFIHFDSTISFYLPSQGIEIKSNFNFITISTLESLSDLKAEMLVAGFIRPV